MSAIGARCVVCYAEATYAEVFDQSLAKVHWYCAQHMFAVLIARGSNSEDRNE
jgi:hypothetical protein